MVLVASCRTILEGIRNVDPDTTNIGHKSRAVSCGIADIDGRFNDKIQVGIPPTQDIQRYEQGATVTIQTKNGRTFSSTVFAPKGAGALGIDWADVDAKYRSLVPRAKVGDQQFEGSPQMIHDFRSVMRVSELMGLLHT